MKQATLAAVLLVAGQNVWAQADATGPAPRADNAPSATTSDLRPLARPENRRAAPSALQQAGFREWLRAFRGRALTQGITSATFDRAMADVEYRTDVIARDRDQAEFNKPIWEYLDRAVSDTRIENGTAALSDHDSLLDTIEARFGVEREIVVAIWGMESAYGEFRGDIPVVSSLATLAHDGRRGSFFEAQLVAALKILQAGHIVPGNMTGSWAGAMGHTQFIPTSFVSYAVDFTEDGKRDIWNDDPADALASTAAYLSGFGWVAGRPWGVEVRLPDDFDYGLARRDVTKSSADWAALGVTRPDGAAHGDHGAASILLPAGAAGPAFMIFSNFRVIERYNTADAYVIGVGHLADRLSGEEPIRAEWPRDDRMLDFDERVELQRLLTASGFDTRGADGKIGPNTLAAIRSYQRERGAVPDGYASLRLLQELRDGA